MTHKRFMAGWIMMLLSIAACSTQDPLTSPDLINVVTVELDTPVIAETASRVVSTGRSPFLYLGEADNRHAGFLVRFATIPDSVNDSLITIDGGRLMLVTNTPLGDTSMTFDATVHRVTAHWDENDSDSTTGVTLDNFGMAFDPAPLATFSVPNSTNDSVFIDLDADLVSTWQDSLQNFGLYVQTQPGAPFMARFNSDESTSPRPRLELFYSLSAPDTISNSPNADAFIFNTVQDPAAGPLYVGNGNEYRTLLKFDMPAFKPNTSINRAALQMHLDLENTYLGSTDGLRVDAFRLTDASMDPLTESVNDSLFLNGLAISLFDPLDTDSVMTDPPEMVVFDLRSQVQRWANGEEENHGVVLLPVNPGSQLFRVGFFNTTADSGKTPMLTIEYSEPPSLE